MLNLLPMMAEQLLHPGLKKNDNGASDVFAGGYLTLLISVFTILLIELSDYMDIWKLHRYDWISQIKPSGQVAYNSLIVTVTENDLKRGP